MNYKLQKKETLKTILGNNCLQSKTLSDIR